MLSLTTLETICGPIMNEQRKYNAQVEANHQKWLKMTHSGEEPDYTLARKYHVELAINGVEYDDVSNQRKRLYKQLEAALRVNRANTTYKKVRGRECRALEREPCAICYEIYGAKQLTTTNCGHTFCRPCFSQLIEICYFDDKEISCPYCRNKNIALVRYYK